MTNRQVVLLAGKIKRELNDLSRGTLTNKKDGFDWQYCGDEILDEEIELEFYWNCLNPIQSYELVRWMHLNTKYNPKLKGGRHDKSKIFYQLCLNLTIQNK